MTIVHVKVTQAHIDAGTPNQPSCCAVALAIKEHVNPDYLIIVGEEWCLELLDTSRTSKNRWVVKLPLEVQHFITVFDNYDPECLETTNGTTPDPFEFEIDLP